MIKYILETFSNREIAFSIWLSIIIVYLLSKNNIRSSVIKFLKVFFGTKILEIYLAMTVYVLLLIAILSYTNIWHPSLLKETIFWYFGIAIILVFNANKIYKYEDHFIKILKDNLKFTVLLEFIITLYSFSLVIELILTPIIMLIVMVSAFSEIKKEYHQFKKVFNGLLFMIGLLFILYAMYSIVTDIDSFANESNVRSFLTPLILTFLFAPFVYLFALLMSYEDYFIRLKIFIKNKNDHKYAKWKVLASFNFRLWEFNKFAKYYLRLDEETKKDIVTAIRIFKKNVKQSILMII